MKALYFEKKSEPGKGFWRCGACKTDHPIQGAEPGILVQFGNDCLAIICQPCSADTRAELSSLVPHSFPDLDAAGRLLVE
jgi:hypothetical protein